MELVVQSDAEFGSSTSEVMHGKGEMSKMRAFERRRHDPLQSLQNRRCLTGAGQRSPAAAPPKKPKYAPEAADILFHRGQVVNNRYTVLDLIGRGGMGCIYKVHDNVLGEDLALKTLLPQYVQDKMVVERFLNEARITRKLAHPNIVRVHDIGMTGNGIFISMEYVQGDSLRSILRENVGRQASGAAGAATS